MITGTIYKIICNVTQEIYIGSTIQDFNKRINAHKSKSNTCSSRQIIERGNFKVEIIEVCQVENLAELRKKENEYILNNETINEISAFRSDDDKKNYVIMYRANNKDQAKINRQNYDKKIFEKYKDSVIRYENGEPYAIKCSCGGHFTPRNESRHKSSTIHKISLPEIPDQKI